MIRYGTISETDPAKGKARVNFEDAGMVSGWLRIIYPATKESKYQHPLAVGDFVAVLHGTDIDDGAILGAVYSDRDTPSGDLGSDDRHGVQFPDGSLVYYDAAASTLVVDSAGKVTVSASQEITATVGQSEFKATPVGLTITAGGVSLKTILQDLLTALIAETHPTPAGPSGPPVNVAQYSALIPQLNILLEA